MNPVKIAQAVQEGYPVYCATCPKYWQSKDKGSNTCAAVDGCKGPVFGGSFHEYSGPITNHAAQCFKCGSAPAYIVTSAGRDFGACPEHAVMFAYLPMNREPARLKTESGLILATDLIVKSRKKSVAEAIYEVEAYYAKKEGRPWP